MSNWAIYSRKRADVGVSDGFLRRILPPTHFKSDRVSENYPDKEGRHLRYHRAIVTSGLPPPPIAAVALAALEDVRHLGLAHDDAALGRQHARGRLEEGVAIGAHLEADRELQRPQLSIIITILQISLPPQQIREAQLLRVPL